MDYILRHSVQILTVFNTVTLEVNIEKLVTISKVPVLARIMVQWVNAYLKKQVPNEVKLIGNTYKDELINFKT